MALHDRSQLFPTGRPTGNRPLELFEKRRLAATSGNQAAIDKSAFETLEGARQGRQRGQFRNFQVSAPAPGQQKDIGGALKLFRDQIRTASVGQPVEATPTSAMVEMVKRAFPNLRFSLAGQEIGQAPQGDTRTFEQAFSGAPIGGAPPPVQSAQASLSTILQESPTEGSAVGTPFFTALPATGIAGRFGGAPPVAAPRPTRTLANVGAQGTGVGRFDPSVGLQQPAPAGTPPGFTPAPTGTTTFDIPTGGGVAGTQINPPPNMTIEQAQAIFDQFQAGRPTFDPRLPEPGAEKTFESIGPLLATGGTERIFDFFNSPVGQQVQQQITAALSQGLDPFGPEMKGLVDAIVGRFNEPAGTTGAQQGTFENLIAELAGGGTPPKLPFEDIQAV